MAYKEITNPEEKFLKDINYPAQTKDPSVKRDKKFGLQYARAMYADWRNGRAQMIYDYREQILETRAYASGFQDIDQYKRRLDTDDEGEESYLNLDWRIVMLMPKFIEIAVGNMIRYDNPIRVEAFDKLSRDQKADAYWNKYVDIKRKGDFSELEQMLGAVLGPKPEEDEPKTIQELDVWNQLNNKLKTEIALEECIGRVMDLNDWREIEKALKKGLLTDGMAGNKTYFTNNGGIKIRQCEPLNMVLPYTNRNDWKNAPHIGEIIPLRMHELRKLAGDQFNENQYLDIAMRFRNKYGNPGYVPFDLNSPTDNPYNDFEVPVMEFEFKTTDVMVHEKKHNKFGGYSMLPRDYNHEVKSTSHTKRERIETDLEMVYSGYWIVGTDYIFNYGVAHNIPRNPSNLYEAFFSFACYAPEMTNGRIVSKGERCIPFINAIQIDFLKIQSLKAEAAPKGVSIEISGLMDVPAGRGGKTLSPLQLIKLFRQKGVVLWNQKGIKGNNHNYRPVEELENGIGKQLQEYIADINFNLEMMRQVFGLNEAADASMPAAEQPVATTKLAVAASNTSMATIYDAYKALKRHCAMIVGDRLQVVSKDKYAREGMVQAMGEPMMKIIELSSEMTLREYGIIVEDIPTDEERQWLEAQIAIAMKAQNEGGVGIKLEDAILIRRINNIKLAEQVLIQRCNRRAEDKAKRDQANIQATVQGQIQSAQAASQLKIQEAAALSKFKIDEINAKGGWDLKLKQLDVTGKMATADETGKHKLIGEHHKSEANKEIKQMELDHSAAEPTAV
jgi:hypothetical protein